MSKEDKTKKVRLSIRKIIKVGNSLAITLPDEFVEDHNLQKGQTVIITFDDYLKLDPLSDKTRIVRLLHKAS